MSDKEIMLCIKTALVLLIDQRMIFCKAWREYGMEGTCTRVCLRARRFVNITSNPVCDTPPHIPHGGRLMMRDIRKQARSITKRSIAVASCQYGLGLGCGSVAEWVRSATAPSVCVGALFCCVSHACYSYCRAVAERAVDLWLILHLSSCVRGVCKKIFRYALCHVPDACCAGSSAKSEVRPFKGLKTRPL